MMEKHFQFSCYMVLGVLENGFMELWNIVEEFLVSPGYRTSCFYKGFEPETSIPYLIFLTLDSNLRESFIYY